MRIVKRIFLFSSVFIALSLLFVFCSVRKYAEKHYEEARKVRPYDVIIVPGVPYEHEKTTKVMLMRILWAKHLYDSGYTRNIIFSGSSVYSPYVEGIAMKLVADTLGLPHDHTFSETKAEHSTENAYNGYKMAKEMGFTKIALATDPFQSAALEGMVRKYCPEMKTIPIVFGILDLSKGLPGIDTQKAFVKDFVSITEREGFWTRFRGTMGKKVKVDYEMKKNHVN